MWHQTWAYPANTTRTVMFEKYGSQLGMYEAICDVTGQLLEKYGFELIPVGTAIQNLRTSFIGDHLTRDAIHLSYTIGRYTAACTWFEAFVHKNAPFRGRAIEFSGLVHKIALSVDERQQQQGASESFGRARRCALL